MQKVTCITTGIIVICMAAVFLAGCTVPDEVPPPTLPPTPPPVYPADGVYSFDQTNDRETHTLPVDATIRLILPENPTTGYTWQLHTSPGIVIVNESYVPDDSTGRLVGSGGTRIWEMIAVQPGIQDISGIHARPWESMAGNQSSFSLTLDVGTSPAASPGFSVYTEADSGKEVMKTVGSTFDIRLIENPTTGYSWNITVSEGLTMVQDTFVPSRTSDHLTGSGGIRLSTIEARETGDQLVHAEYRRPWVPAGMVIFVDLEGGFYGIRGDDGEDYYPLELEEEFRANGLRVSFESEPAKDVVTIHMWGTPVTLTYIEEMPLFDLRVRVT